MDFLVYMFAMTLVMTLPFAVQSCNEHQKEMKCIEKTGKPNCGVEEKK